MTLSKAAAVLTVRSCWPLGAKDNWLALQSTEDLVSVVVPAFNREKLIRRALDSVTAQTYRPIELIVVDDGSSDCTSSVVREWMAANEREDFICRLIVQKNGGAAAARNTGVQACTGEYIQYLDSDDVMHPQKLEIHVGLLRSKPDFDYIWSDHTQFESEPGREFIKRHSIDETRRMTVEIRSAEVFSTTAGVFGGLYRRELHRRTGLQNEKLKVWEDVEFSIRMTALRPNVLFVPVPLISMGNDATARTDHTYATLEGVAAGLQALETCECVLDAVAEPVGGHARNSLTGFYYRVLLNAVVLKMPEAVKSALAGMRRNRGADYFFLVRVAVFEIILFLGAARIALFAAQAYSRWRLRRTVETVAGP